MFISLNEVKHGAKEGRRDGQTDNEVDSYCYRVLTLVTDMSIETVTLVTDMSVQTLPALAERCGGKKSADRSNLPRVDTSPTEQATKTMAG